MSLIALFNRRSKEAAVPETIQQTAWPEGVIARYLTVSGATVDLRAERSDGAYIDSGDCTGCGFHIDWGPLKYARQKAQAHAETCRALPRPDGA